MNKREDRIVYHRCSKPKAPNFWSPNIVSLQKGCPTLNVSHGQCSKPYGTHVPPYPPGSMTGHFQTLVGGRVKKVEMVGAV